MVNTTEKIYDLSQRAKKNHAVQRWKFIYYSGEGGYRIQNMSTKGYLYVESGSTENSVRLLVTPSIYSNNSAQIWNFQYDNSGIITIVNKKSGKTLINYGANFGVDGSKMVQWPIKTWTKWVITPNGRTYSNYFMGTQSMSLNGLIDSYFVDGFSHDPNRRVTYKATQPASVMIESMRYSDFVWFNGHGTNGLQLKNSDEYIYGYIHPDDIGTFKNNTKWIAIQACSQLDLRDIGQGSYNLAKNWAQTMRSTEGNRLHGILGYWGEAPGSKEEDRLNAFAAYYFKDSPYLILGRWRMNR